MWAPVTLGDHRERAGPDHWSDDGRDIHLSATSKPVESGGPLHVLGETVRPVMTEAMGSSIEICDVRGPAGTGPPAHRHPWEEIYLVLDGAIEINVDSRTRRLEAGAVAHVPADTVHSLRNVTEAHFLTITAKGNAIRFYTALSEQVGPKAPDPDDLFRIAEDHDIQILA